MRFIRPYIAYVLLVAIGVLAGAAAWLLKHGIGLVSRWMLSGISAEGPCWRMLMLPVAGMVAAGLYQKYVQRHTLERGTDQILDRLHSGRLSMPASFTFSPLLCNILTLGMGGSAGAEGPIAFSSAATASVLGTRAGVDAPTLRMLVVCGAAAGIAAIFSAPLAGVFFAVEVLGAVMTTRLFVWLFTVCIIAGGTSLGLHGWVWPVAFTTRMSMHVYHVMWVVLLGILAGLFSLFYSSGGRLTQCLLARVRGPYALWIVSGLWVGVWLLVFPALYGEGYDALNGLLSSDGGAVLRCGVLGRMAADHGEGLAVALSLAGIMLCKGSVTMTTNIGGGVAGTFAPTLFAGGMCGYLFGMVAAWAGCAIGPAVFAFLGMAAVMSGVIRAPFMAMFLPAEMSGDYSMLIPLAAVSVVSYAVASSFPSLWRKVTQRL